MNELINECEEIVTGVYSEGFQDGQLAMIETLHDLGIVNKRMARFLRTIPCGGEAMVDEHINTDESHRIIGDAVQKILKL